MRKKRKARVQDIHIDQSGKIEQTNKDTVLCLAYNSEDGAWDAIVIKARTKRQLQEIFRRNGQPRNYVLFSFCAGLSFLIKRSTNIPMVIIDREYFGKEAVIKEILLEMLKDCKKIPEISFGSIGRKVQAHLKGYRVYSGKLPAKKTVSLTELFKAIKKTEVGSRLKDA